MSDSQGRTPSAVTFHGSWIDFAKIALPNCAADFGDSGDLPLLGDHA